jgi:HTH-type transcriptional regulator, transcriptional repressor of NAD biosynthesis genes
MKIGLTLGKFMPLHSGHLALIDFAASRCDLLYVLLCFNDKTEPIAGEIRWNWLQTELQNRQTIVPCFTDADLPNSSVASHTISAAWAVYLKARFPDVTTFFSSEPYGEYVAEYWGISYENFDINRQNVPVSATKIRENPLKHWHFLAKAAQPFYTKKIALVGTESTGKTTLCAKLAAHFNTVFVPEAGREVVANSAETRYEDIAVIAEKHAAAIEHAQQHAQKLIFIDTDLTITESYSLFFFGKTPAFPDKIRRANEMDYYFYLQPDAPFVQDGTRLNELERQRLNEHHLRIFNQKGIALSYITGNYTARFTQIAAKIQELL